MKPYTYSLLAAALACGMAQGAATAYTTPVGYVSIGNGAAAVDNVPANTDVLVSIPVLKSAAYQGTVSAVGADTITLANAPAFTVNQWTATPHVIVIESGANSGLIAPILSNTADQLTLGLGVFSLTGTVATDSVSIRPAWTVSNFMAGASSLTGVQLLTYSNTSATINNSADGLFFYVGGNWENGDGDPANDVILYPGDAFIVRTTATPIVDFSVSGEVPLANSYIAIGEKAGGPRDTAFAYFSPVSEPLGSSGLGFASGDVLLDFDNNSPGLNKSGIPYFYVGGGNWENGDGDPAGTFELQGGRGYVYRRASAASTGYVISQNEQSFIPSL